MKTVLQSFVGSLLAIVLLVVIAAGYGACAAGKTPDIEKESWLVIDLFADLPEFDPPTGVLGELTGDQPETLQRVLDNLDKARVDDRIEGVVIRMSTGASATPAKYQEIRGAIKRVQEAGKRVIGYGESFTQRQYVVLAACDEVVSPREAYITFVGFATGSMHVKRALDKLGINPNLSKIKDYKAAAELVTRDSASEAAVENDEWLLAELWEMYVDALAEDRGFDEAEMIALMEHAAFTPDEAVEHGLVDRLAFWDELAAELKGDDDDDDEDHIVPSATYAKISPEDVGLKGKKIIAVVHAQGTIAGRKNGVNPLLGMMMGHETISGELERARKDEDVAAVILRVDSGGGDSLTSGLIGRQLERTTGDKPVVASMAGVAASGGYQIAFRADRIVADPMTITGSIGSISAKFNMAGLYDRLGISFSHVTRGPMALINASDRDFTPEEWARFEDNHWDSFNQWLAEVADKRGMSFEEAELLAHGRVWTGRQAVDNGLVDELGDLTRAIEVAKELAEIPADEGVTVVHYPEAKGLLESVLGGEITTLARWTVYRMIRDDLRQTWSLVQSNPQLVASALGED